MNTENSKKEPEPIEIPVIYLTKLAISDIDGLSQDEDLRPFLAGSIGASILGRHALTGPYKGYGSYSTGKYVGSLKDGRAIVAAISQPEPHLQYTVESVVLG